MRKVTLNWCYIGVLLTHSAQVIWMGLILHSGKAMSQKDAGRVSWIETIVDDMCANELRIQNVFNHGWFPFVCNLGELDWDAWETCAAPKEVSHLQSEKSPLN